MIELGLQRISHLLARTALPWRAIHVAGTNGKGSICAYVSGMLEVYNRSGWRKWSGRSALKHGRFTSPHLIDRWDCITLNQQPVSPSVFKEIEREVHERNAVEGVGASEFEILTAAAFEIFTRATVDIGVVEVGMGGRLDATNVIGQWDGLSLPNGVPAHSFRPPPLVTAISSIGLDHQAFLGNTLEEIAREKAGIVKPRVPVVYAPNPSTVVEAFLDVARNRRSPMYAAEEELDAMTSDPRSLSGLLHYLEAHHSPGPLPGHARVNARVAFMSTWIALQRLGRLPIDIAQVLEPVDDRPIPPTIEMFQVPWNISFPGRLQQISLEALTGREASILLDGAHNAQSAQALRSEVERLGYRDNGRNTTWVLAASDTKDPTEILAPLLRNGDTVFFVEFGPVDGMPWVKAQRGNVLTDAARKVVPKAESLTVHDYGRNIRAALKSASKVAGSGPLVVAGSLYVVGDVLRLVREAS